MPQVKRPSVICFCGGNGANTIASALAGGPFSLCCVVNGYDDGRSTGEIRRFFGRLGPSDFRKNHLNLLSLGRAEPAVLKQLWSFRFPRDVARHNAMSTLQQMASGRPRHLELDEGFQSLPGKARALLQSSLERFLTDLPEREKSLGRPFPFADASLSNCVYAGAVEAAGGDWYAAASALEAALGLEASVVPISPENRWLASLTCEGTVLESEFQTDTSPIGKLVDLFLLKEPIPGRLRHQLSLLPLEQKAARLLELSDPPGLGRISSLRIAEADVIIYGPGTRSTSFFPTYLARGLGALIRKNRHATKLLVTNISTENGVGYRSAMDCLMGTTAYLRRSDETPGEMCDYVDAVLVNEPDGRRRRSGDFVVPAYREIGKLPVEVARRSFEDQEARGTHLGPLVVAEMQRIIHNR